MEVSIIKIGNSRGIRFSKTIMEKYNFRDKVELTLDNDKIIIKPVANPREAWEKSFKEMAENGDDQLLINDVFDDENIEEWK